MKTRRYRKKGSPLTQSWLLGRLKKLPNGCWEWQCYRNAQGYGQTWREGRLILVHRLAYELFVGKISPDISVLHNCDNPPCANPQHLFKGDQIANMLDMVRKGRQQRGATHSQAKLVEADIVKIRADGRDQATIAAEYGVDPSNVSCIKRRVTWRHVQ
jgi:hypothetical protein